MWIVQGKTTYVLNVVHSQINSQKVNYFLVQILTSDNTNYLWHVRISSDHDRNWCSWLVNTCVICLHTCLSHMLIYVHMLSNRFLIDAIVIDSIIIKIKFAILYKTVISYSYSIAMWWSSELYN